MSITRGMDKENVVYPYNGLLLSHKKEWSPDMNYKGNESQKLYANWKKPDTKDHILYNSICMNYPE